MNNFVVAFICTGNICRSPMAEAILKDLILDEYDEHRRIIPIEVISAGTHAVNGIPASSHAVEVASRHGNSLRFHRSRLLTPHVASAADLILTMEAAHSEFIRQLVPGIKTVFELKRYLNNETIDQYSSDIVDPMGRGLDFYSMVYNEIEHEIKRIVQPLFVRALEKYRMG